MHIFIKVGGEIKGRKIKLLKHVFLLYSLTIIFSKIFSLATLAQLRFILHVKMQVCNVLYQPHLYFFFIFGVIISDCQLPKFTEKRIKYCTKLRTKWPKIVCRDGGGEGVWRKKRVGETWELGGRAPWLLGDRRLWVSKAQYTLPTPTVELRRVGVGVLGFTKVMLSKRHFVTSREISPWRHVRLVGWNSTDSPTLTPDPPFRIPCSKQSCDNIVSVEIWSVLIDIYVCTLQTIDEVRFYRAMHFSAFARSWDRMSSVCLSVCL